MELVLYIFHDVTNMLKNFEFQNHDFTLSISGGHSLVVGLLGIHSVST